MKKVGAGSGGRGGGAGGGGRGGGGLMAALAASGGAAGLRKRGGRGGCSSPAADDGTAAAPCPQSPFVQHFRKFCASARARLAAVGAVIADAVALSNQTTAFFGEASGSKPQGVFAILIRFSF